LLETLLSIFRKMSSNLDHEYLLKILILTSKI
jgi:hypothetical protein